MDDGTLWRALLKHARIEKVGDSEESSIFQVEIGTSWEHATLEDAVKAVAQINEAPVFGKLSSSVQDRIIRTIAEQLGYPITSITADKSIIADLQADSLDTIELIMALEDEFNVEIPDEVAESVVTVGDILNHKFWIQQEIKTTS